MNVEIASRMVDLRKRNNLSQEELASRLGVSRQAVSKWERAEASPDTDNLILLARLYQVSLDQLLMTGQPDEEILQDAPSQAEPAPELELDPMGYGAASQAQANMEFEQAREQSFAQPKDAASQPFEEFQEAPRYQYVGGEDYAQQVPPTQDYPSYKEDEEQERKNFKHFKNRLDGAFPILIVMTYLIAGMGFGLWHPGWMIFFLIPLYYIFDPLDGIYRSRSRKKKAVWKDGVSPSDRYAAKVGLIAAVAVIVLIGAGIISFLGIVVQEVRPGRASNSEALGETVVIQDMEIAEEKAMNDDVLQGTWTRRAK